VGIGLAINVGDSLVFATDSATPGTRETINSRNSAYEIFNLRKEMPIGAMAWGLPRVGNLSTRTMVKDLRLRLTGQDPSYRDWELDPANYTVWEVAHQGKRYFYDDLLFPSRRADLA
jgi:hypothetical protein